MTTDPSAAAVTFDFGQTLCELDTGMLSRRLAEHGLEATEAQLEAGVLEAWRAYDQAILAGLGGHPWKLLMGRLLALAGIAAEPAGDAVDWLWTEQPAQNLWRRPIPGMLELVRDLHRAGVPLGVISNSEGRLVELIEETGFAGLFVVVADSGRLGFEKPGERIFAWTAEQLGAAPDRIVHVGDSYPADVQGALAAGLRAIWFKPRTEAPLPPRARAASSAPEVKAALSEWHLAR